MKAVIFIHVLYLILIKAFIVSGVAKCESKVELRAVLLSCPTKDTGCDDDDLLSQAIKSEESQLLQAESKNFESLREEKEKGFSNAVKDCKRKLVITVKIKNVGKIPCDDEYIVVDHVFDPVTGGRGRLLSPVVLKLRQEQMTHLYGLQFQRVVNSDPFEEQKASGQTCSVRPENPTCGITMYDGKPIPFSEGFCCSYDQHVNAKRQLMRTTRGDSLFYRGYKMIYQGAPYFARNEKTSIVDPNLVKLKIRSSEKAVEDKKSLDNGGFGDPLSWDKIPNYLLEHDRKVICDRGDFMNELCKLREDKYYTESSSAHNSQSKGDKGNGKGKDMKSDRVRRGVRTKEDDLEKLDLTTVEVDGKASKENLLENEQRPNVNLSKNFIKFLKVDEITGKSALSNNSNSVKKSRGKRENRNDNKKLTLEEKLENYMNLKSHLKSPRKRLLELSHKRLRKSDDRNEKKEECEAVVVPGFMENDYVRSPPPKYFFSHDKFIIDPLESFQMTINSSYDTMKEFPYEEAKDKTFELQNKNVEKHVGELSRSFYQDKLKGKEKFILGRIMNKKDRVFHNEGGKIENNIGSGKVIAESLEESLKIPPFARANERFGSFIAAEENEGKAEEIELQKAKKPVTEERKVSGLHCKSLKNLFHKTNTNQKMSKPQKIRNFFMARNRERQKVKSEFVKDHKNVEVDHKNELFKCKSSKEEENNDSSANSEEKKSMKEDEITMKNPLAQEERDSKENCGVSNVEENVGKPSLSQSSLNKEADIQNKENEKRKEKGIERNFGHEKVGENTKEENNYMKQSCKGNAMDSSRSHPSKEFTGDTDFSFEIIRRTFPEYVKPKYHWGVRTPASNIRKSGVSHPFDVEAPDPLKKFNYQKKKQDLRLHEKPPPKYYLFENEMSPHHMYLLQNDKNLLKDVKDRQRYLREPETEPQLESYVSTKLYNNFQPDYRSYSLKKLFLNHHNYEPHYPKYEDDLAKFSRRLQPYHNNKLSSSQLRGKRYSALLRFENGHMKIGYRPVTFEGKSEPHFDKFRSKRSATYSFQPVKGFFRSAFASQGSEDRTVREAETFLPELTAKKSEEGIDWARRIQSSRFKRENASIDIYGISNSQRLQKGFNCPKVTSKEKTNKGEFDKQRLMKSYLNAPDYVLEEVDATMKEKRQTAYPSKINCSRKGETAFAAEQDTQDTAHCMRFGDMWYSLYTIKKPLVSQTVGIQLFDKHLLWDGTSQWRDLTKGKMIRVGTFLPKAEDELPSISVNFMGGNAEKGESAIDPDNYFLLIPSHVSNPSKVNSYPQLNGGPAEYLLVQSKDVSTGGECNMVGTSFEAFARQPDRCNQRKGSCLKRQPVDLWREDMEARIRGKRGKYFVENFGTVPNSSVKTYTNLTGDFLALEYYGEYTSTIEIEVKADSNAVVRKGSNGQIPLVYIDSTYPKKTRIILSVLNIGLTSSYFRPRLGDCPPDLDPAWCPLEGPLVNIPPQQRHDFKLDLSGALTSRQILVSVQVLNQVNKKIASRKIIIKRGDRCVCAFHCKCNCIGNSADERTCRRLSLKEYRRAGYIGSFPFREGTAASTPENILKNIHIVLLTASYVLLLLGVMKGILGIFIRRIGIAGVRIITGPRELKEYYECELEGCPVLLDAYGFPVHPTTCQPVQIVPLWLETTLNIFFFFLYPLRGLWYLLLSLPCSKTICFECEGHSQHNEGDSDQKSSRPLLSKGISPTCVHYNLTTINSKKSKQHKYLPYPAYKGDDDPLEEDDTEFVLQEIKRYRKE